MTAATQTDYDLYNLHVDNVYTLKDISTSEEMTYKLKSISYEFSHYPPTNTNKKKRIYIPIHQINIKNKDLHYECSKPEHYECLSMRKKYHIKKTDEGDLENYQLENIVYVFVPHSENNTTKQIFIPIEEIDNRETPIYEYSLQTDSKLQFIPEDKNIYSAEEIATGGRRKTKKSRKSKKTRKVKKTK